MQKFIFILFFILLPSFTYAFDIYGRVPWSIKQGDALITNQQEVKEILSKRGIQQIDVVYHNRIFTNGQVDSEKIKKIAEESNKNAHIPVSFDIELSNRFKPDTVLPIINTVIDLYRAYGGKAKIGLYANLPQQTYGGGKLNNEMKQKYIELNKHYESLALKVDFLSPSFYFYDNEDIALWKKAVDFNMEQSKKIAKKYNLKIYPYVTNAFITSKVDPITKGWTVKLLTCKQMHETIRYVESRGADGVIIWNSSNVLDENGVKPIIQLHQSWFKGINSFDRSCK